MQNGNKIIFLKLLKSFLFLLIPLCSFSQFNLFRNFNVKDGLPSSEVYETMQDSKGYFWFATDMGVSRFNGYEFKNFSTENGLPDNTIYGLHEDAKQNVWFRSLSGKLSYYTNKEIRTLPCNNDLVYILKNLTITSLHVDSKDTIWIGVNSNFLVKIAPGRHKNDISKVLLRHDGLYVYEIENGFIYGGSPPSEYLYTFYKNAKIKNQERNTNAIVKNVRYSVIHLKDKSYLVTMNNVVLNFNENRIIYKYENENYNICSLEDENRNILLGSYGGIGILNKYGFLEDKSYKMLDQKIITSLCIDTEHELWICTKGHGVFYVPFREFKYYTTADGLPESSISCINTMEDELFTGHINGKLSVFKGANIKVIKLESKDSIIGNEITSLLKVDNNKIIISSVKGIYELDKLTQKVTLVKNIGSKKVIKLNNSDLLMSLGFRVLRTYDPNTFDVMSQKALPNYSDNIFERNDGKVLICSSNGLWILDKEKTLKFAGEKDTLLASRIVDVAEGKNGLLWFATRGEGVLIKKNNKLIQIRQRDGLSGNMCRTLLLDSNNVIWVATNNGLNKIVIENYEPLKYHITNYNSKNGLLTNEVNYMIRFKNKLWLAHNNGISVFNPIDIQDNRTPPPVYITSIKVNEVILSTDKHVTLTHDENYLTINYNGLTFKDPGNIEYKHKLEGLDTNWIYTNYTSVNFQGVSPGKYKFVVYAKNNDGHWSTAPAFFEFVIEPAWWQTWWFWLTIFIACVALFIVGKRLKLKVSFS